MWLRSSYWLPYLYLSLSFLYPLSVPVISDKFCSHWSPSSLTVVKFNIRIWKCSISMLVLATPWIPNSSKNVPPAPAKYRDHLNPHLTFLTRYFLSPSVCHKNSRFCWKLLRTFIYSLELEKSIITFFQEKHEKSEFITTDIYRKIYWYTPIYRTPIYRYKYIERNTSIFWYIDISVPSLMNAHLQECYKSTRAVR